LGIIFMALEAKKQERETTQSLIRRFTKRVQRSGILIRARKSRFHQRSKSRQMRKEAALRREKLRKDYEKLKKLGKLGK
jgi:ribosomal protein S21